MSLIDNLPDNIFKKILSYVPSRRNSARVNKKFYNAVCELDNNEDIYKFHFVGKFGEEVRFGC